MCEKPNMSWWTLANPRSCIRIHEVITEKGLSYLYHSALFDIDEKTLLKESLVKYVSYLQKRYFKEKNISSFPKLATHSNPSTSFSRSLITVLQSSSSSTIMALITLWLYLWIGETRSQLNLNLIIYFLPFAKWHFLENYNPLSRKLPSFCAE